MHRDWRAGDWIVLYSPVAVAFVCHSLIWIVRLHSREKSHDANHAVVLGAALSLVAFFITMLLTLNLYGS
jgi:hypothetical protein